MFIDVPFSFVFNKHLHFWAAPLSGFEYSCGRYLFFVASAKILKRF